MSKDTSLEPVDYDPSTFDPDRLGVAGEGTVPGMALGASAGGPQYRPMTCHKLSDKTFVGHLSNRFSNSTAIGTGNDYPPAMCYWYENSGAMYLAIRTDLKDRYLGVSDYDYACWSLWQARNMGYFTNVIHNQNGTISPGISPGKYLAGPYRKNGVDWTYWADAGNPDILVCELEIGSAPTWQNWSGNIEHLAGADKENYYFTPKNLNQLKSVLTEAKKKGVYVRVSGQRHSQSPLVADDNRNKQPPTASSFIVDMSCYVDVGVSGIALVPGKNQVVVNAGIKEDAVDAFLTQNNLMFKTVTAGGFFSVGGMTAVDVHGGTVEGPIFAETACAFTLLGPDGNLTTIDASSPAVNGWSPLQFARVSLGGLGIVTSITFDVLPRAYATSLTGEVKRHLFKEKSDFVAGFKDILTGPDKYDRMEVFYSPYAAAPNLPVVNPMPNFLVLGYRAVENPVVKTPNSALDPQSACVLAGQGEFGAPELNVVKKKLAQTLVRDSQYYSSAYLPVPIPPSGCAAIALDEIESQAGAANAIHSDLWLAQSTQVMFMSYYIELPDLSPASLGKVWDGLDVVARRVILADQFHIAAPMEFRFVKAGNSAMSGSFSTNPNAYFVNLDLIGFIGSTPTAEYPVKMLQFFADVEREWVAMGGFPHNGKMYGFYDPTAPAGTYSQSGAFNPNFLTKLRGLRGERLKAFNSFRQSKDPLGLFYNDFLRQLMEA